ncbi:hypothetical protein N7492_008981 [Penicillium capsulatum]|uniref:Uncharacterized protein n=1 Tax=Penicillium capsulatum TaxID=69766 RepID=A0A9W9LHH2_9EURO|nr:hypothetical protein N7492_008981 [Penicillium capsulatum]KAJ6106382.1 hypothetical protein N7512_009899 [Penicillium capsulatum]
MENIDVTYSGDFMCILECHKAEESVDTRYAPMQQPQILTSVNTIQLQTSTLNLCPCVFRSASDIPLKIQRLTTTRIVFPTRRQDKRRQHDSADPAHRVDPPGNPVFPDRNSFFTRVPWLRWNGELWLRGDGFGARAGGAG